MNKLFNKREWYTLKNNQDENEIMLLMSLHYDYKDDQSQLNNNQSLQGIQNIKIQPVQSSQSKPNTKNSIPQPFQQIIINQSYQQLQHKSMIASYLKQSNVRDENSKERQIYISKVKPVNTTDIDISTYSIIIFRL